MKHQYFGDIIDLFKFDLLESLRKDLLLGGITYVVMLTENDQRNDGNRRNYDKAIAGKENLELLTFVKNYQDVKDRNVTEINKYFATKGILFSCLNEEFKHKERKKYFSEISKSDLNNQLIFFDPDNGLEIMKSNHKHIKFEELRKCYDEIDDKSIISVIQFKSREKWEETTLPNKLRKFKDYDFVTCIYGPAIAFFIIAKTEKRLGDIQDSLKKYVIKYPSLKTI